MRLIRKVQDAIFLFLFGTFTFLFFLPFSPFVTPNPNSDSGIFINAGSEILKGKILYLQIWDNKQPLLYGINALGLWLGKGSVWGVWGLELGLYAAALLLTYKLVTKFLSSLIGFVVLSATFVSINQFFRGNSSEEYAVVLQLFILAILFFGYLPTEKKHSKTIFAGLIGVLSGLVFFIKPTYVDISGVVFLFIVFVALLENDKKIIFRILLMILGFAFVAVPIVLYFMLNHALDEYILDAFLFYRYYAMQGPMEFLYSVKAALKVFIHDPFLFAMLVVWILGTTWVCVRGWKYVKAALKIRFSKWVSLFLGICFFGLFIVARIQGGFTGMGFLEWAALLIGGAFLLISGVLFIKRQEKSVNPGQINRELKESLAKYQWKVPGLPAFLLIGLLDLPLQVIAISLSGNNFLHYYITLFVPLLFMLAVLAAFLDRIITNPIYVRILRVGMAIILIFRVYRPISQVTAAIRTRQESSPIVETATYVQSKTLSQDPVLQWGWESFINFLADREAPTRYSIQYPLYFATPWQDQARATLLGDIQSNPPRYIVDTMDPNMPFIDGQTMQHCLSTNPADGDGMQKILNYVCSNYEFEKSIGSINIYRYTQ